MAINVVLTNGIISMAVEAMSEVKLTETDFMILETLREGRNLAANIAVEIDKSRKYINSKMPYLLDYGLVNRVGPAEDTGLYELTLRGEIAVQNRDKYHDDDVDFEDFLKAAVAEEPE